MIPKNAIYAVAGVSANSDKYGYKVFKDLLDSGYKAYGINPKGGEILGQKIYADISNLPEKPDWLILVTQPEVSAKLAEEAIAAGIKNVWFQPGSESALAIEKCRAAGINCIANACIMIKRHEG